MYPWQMGSYVIKAELRMNRRILVFVLSLAIISAGRPTLAQANTVESARAASPDTSSTPSQSKSEAAAQTTNTTLQVDLTALINAAVANARRNALLANQYTSQESVVETWYDKHGKFQEHTSKRDVVGVGEAAYKRLIELDGKPISEEEQAKRERTARASPKLPN